MNLEGSLTEDIGELQHLQNLYVPKFNCLNVPFIQHDFSSRYMADNKLTGRLPFTLGKLKSLKHL